MTIPIYIPSMGRAEDIPYQSPMLDMTQEVIDAGYRVNYVVPPDEAERYREILAPWENTQVLECPESGIAKTRLWIGQHAGILGMPRFLMLDDDIRFLVRRSEETWQLRGTEGDEVVQCLQFVERMLGEGGFSHVGISAREGNNRFGEGGPDDLLNQNTRTLRALAYRTEDFLDMRHGRVEVMEDFDVNLQLLEASKPNCCVGYWAQGQKMTNAPGGCSTYRSHEVHERSAHRLAELHPGLVSLREKHNKTDSEGFGTRTEVTIQWKRAYNG